VTQDNLQSLIRYFPVNEFKPLLAEAKRDPTIIWDTCEKFFIRLKSMEDIYDRLQVWLYYRQTEQNIKDIEGAIEDLKKAFKEVRSNEMIKQLLGAVLKVGNCLNAGNKNRG